MKTIATYRLSLCFLLLLSFAAGCRKVSDRLDLMTEGLSAVAAPATVLVGDSLTIVGRIHLSASPTVSLGGVPAVYKQVAPENTPDVPYTVEALRFEVTAEMGEGRQPLEIRLGEHVQVLYVNVLAKPVFDGSRPDTTLVMEEIFGGNITDFTTRYANAYTFNAGEGNDYFPGRSVTADGVIYLQSAMDIYRIENGQVQTLLKTGDALLIDGQEVHVKEFLPGPFASIGYAFSGMAVSADNSTMYLSVYTDMTGHEDFTGAWLLLKTTPDLDHFEVINRTWYKLDGFATFFFPEDFLDNGPIENTQLIAGDLFVDAQQRLLFSNQGVYAARLEQNGRIAKIADEEDNAYYTPDGSTAFFITQAGLTKFDLDAMEPLAVVPLSYANWNFVSFEENPDWRFPNNLGPLNLGGGSFLALPGGQLLCNPLSSSQPSIGAINPENTSVYTFAGIEKGFVGDNLPGGHTLFDVQYHLSGQARYVNFCQYYNNTDFIGNCKFLGMDGQNNIYLMRAGERSRLGRLGVVMPPVIYRLGKP
ncbi:hypothetical protein [Chitinophaga barathri]|uniref:Uncharacterized protein n=1 Tax=Chitinophaga barathri TaxID=1647451 RepID=A0A3N4M8N0_9BACT|nr:hypothetical protein [Chitinophaga barathri]RPD39962.1 hypothetical protein EG028_17725 [Chitinophaga barathri]